MRHSLIALTGIAALTLAGAAQAGNPHGGGNGGGHGNANGHTDMHMPNSHASDRAMEVHRMLANGENPGHAYGRSKTHGTASTHRSARAAANTRLRGSSDVLGNNTHASARGKTRGSLSTTHATADHSAKASARTKKSSRK